MPAATPSDAAAAVLRDGEPPRTRGERFAAALGAAAWAERRVVRRWYARLVPFLATLPPLALPPTGDEFDAWCAFAGWPLTLDEYARIARAAAGVLPPPHGFVLYGIPPRSTAFPVRERVRG